MILQNKGDFILWKPSNHHRTQMMTFWRRYNDLFTRCLNFSLIYIQFHVIFLTITPSMESLHILSGPFLYIIINLPYQKFRWHITYVCPCNSLNSYCKYPSAKEHNLVRRFYKHIRASVSSIEVNFDFPSPLELKKWNHPFTVRRAG